MASSERKASLERKVLRVRHLEDAAVVRAVVRRWALREGLDARAAGEVALGASELATNLVKHAGGGELALGIDDEGMEVVSLDRGPGPPAREELLRDGWTRGAARLADAPVRLGLGSGGAALGRLFDRVDVEARDGGGAVIRCRRRSRTTR